MACLEKQQAQIIDRLDSGIARGIRLHESRKDSAAPIRSVDEIKRELKEPDSLLAQHIANREWSSITSELYESWIIERFVKAKDEIEQIVPRNVRATRRAKFPTDEIFEDRIDEAIACLDNKRSSVLYSVDECLERQVAYRPEGVEELANIKRLAKTTRTRLRIFRSRFLCMIFSGWFIALLCLVTVVSVFAAYYFGIFDKLSGSKTFVEAAPAVVAQAKADAAKIAAVSQDPGKSFFERFLETVKAISELVEQVPKIFATITALWVLVRKWVIGS